jgi:hypothetical protein
VSKFNKQTKREQMVLSILQEKLAELTSRAPSINYGRVVMIFAWSRDIFVP